MVKKSEQGYPQALKTFAVMWVVKGLYKYLLRVKFYIVTEYCALRFIYYPTKSSNRSSAAKTT